MTRTFLWPASGPSRFLSLVGLQMTTAAKITTTRLLLVSSLIARNYSNKPRNFRLSPPTTLSPTVKVIWVGIFFAEQNSLPLAVYFFTKLGTRKNFSTEQQQQPIFVATKRAKNHIRLEFVWCALQSLNVDGVNQKQASGRVVFFGFISKILGIKV